MTWDRGLDYDYIKNKLERTLKNPKNDKQYAYTTILYTQLLNGTRISEAVRAVQEFAKTGKRELNIKLSKKKREEKRLIIIPDNIQREKCLWIGDENEEALTERVKAYAKYKYGINTHSLRYAFITHLLKQNVNPSIIAKITHHSKLDFILTYTQEKEAEKTLRENVQS
jgi:site-specific recombinase XerD